MSLLCAINACTIHTAEINGCCVELDAFAGFGTVIEIAAQELVMEVPIGNTIMEVCGTNLCMTIPDNDNTVSVIRP